MLYYDVIGVEGEEEEQDITAAAWQMILVTEIRMSDRTYRFFGFGENYPVSLLCNTTDQKVTLFVSGCVRQPYLDRSDHSYSAKLQAAPNGYRSSLGDLIERGCRTQPNWFSARRSTRDRDRRLLHRSVNFSTPKMH